MTAQPVAFHKLKRDQLLTLAIALQDQRDQALAALDSMTTEYGVRRDADSAIYSEAAARDTVERQRKRKMKSFLIKRQVGPWELVES
jgi:hypothetical protein